MKVVTFSCSATKWKKISKYGVIAFIVKVLISFWWAAGCHTGSWVCVSYKESDGDCSASFNEKKSPTYLCVYIVIYQSRLHSHSGTFIHLRWTNRGKILLANPSIAAVALHSLHIKHKETPKAVSEACHHYYPADTWLVPQHFTQLTRTTNF